jgi:predicted amino acid racemase
MARPFVSIDLEKIEPNARALVDLCRLHVLTVTGVTKDTCGHPEVARAMLRVNRRHSRRSSLQNQVFRRIDPFHSFYETQ